jgi:hypothetical protein
VHVPVLAVIVTVLPEIVQAVEAPVEYVMIPEPAEVAVTV